MSRVSAIILALMLLASVLTGCSGSATSSGPAGPGMAEPSPMEPVPAEPAPTEPEPVEPDPVEPDPVEPVPVEPPPVEPSPAEPRSVEPGSIASSNFAIEGKWKNVGEGTFGQAQKGSIVAFDGKNCNFFSPQDTYAFYKDGATYRLDATSLLFSQNLSFTVKIIDNDNIEINTGGSVVVMKRVG